MWYSLKAWYDAVLKILLEKHILNLKLYVNNKNYQITQ